MINDLNEEIFCQASDSAAAPTFVERLMQWCLQRQKSNAREVMSPLDDMEHHLTAYQLWALMSGHFLRSFFGDWYLQRFLSVVSVW
jgi:hypothetical protein